MYPTMCDMPGTLVENLTADDQALRLGIELCGTDSNW